jgi:hypothetical protein
MSYDWFLRGKGDEMKIYIATSWKNAFACRTLAELLRTHGHEVYDFTDPKSNAHVFSMDEFLKRETLAWHDKKPSDITQAMLEDMPLAVKAYENDIAAVEWSDCVVMLLPCGNSAHMEAGYAKGAGKLLYITGTQNPGDYDVMRLMADGRGDLEDLTRIFNNKTGGFEMKKNVVEKETGKAVPPAMLKQGAFEMHKLENLCPSSTNPRKVFDDQGLKDLAASIKDKGILQPLIVRRGYDQTDEPSEYEIVCGERRYRAAQLAGLKEVPVIVMDLTDQQVIEIQVIENLQAEAGDCSTCLKNTAAQRDLFGDEGNKDRCTDKKCWEKKKAAQGDRLVKKYKAEGRTILQGAEAESANTDYNHLKGYGSSTWRSALKDTKYQPVLAIDGDGQIQQLVSVPDAIKFVPKAKLVEGHSESGKKERWAKIREKQFNRRVILETNIRAGRTAKEKFLKSKLINKDSFDFVFDAVISNINSHDLELALLNCGYSEKEAGDPGLTFDKLRVKGPMLKKADLLCEILLQGAEPPDNEYGNDWDSWENGDPFEDGGSYYLFLTRLGIDWNEIKKQVVLDLKAEDAEKVCVGKEKEVSGKKGKAKGVKNGN